MEQKPLPGAEPFAPPSADLAMQYLQEASAVEDRREKFVDRRGMAVLRVWETVVLASYVTLVVLLSGATSVGVAIPLVLMLFFSWLQLSAELRTSFGFQIRNSGVRVRYAMVAIAVVFAFMVVATMQGVWGSLPLWARFVPGVLILLVFAPKALVELRQTTRRPHSALRALTVSERVMTIALGVLVAIVVVVDASAPPMVSAIAMPVMMVALLGWFIASQITDRIPNLGLFWRWPQWSAYAILWLVAVSYLLSQVHETKAPPAVWVAASVVIVVLFVIAAFMKGRGVRDDA